MSPSRLWAPTSPPRRWARRAMLSALAGGGLGAAGLGGPLVGGALGAEAQTATGTTGEAPSPPVTETSPQASTPSQEPSPSGAGEASGAGAAEANTTATSTAASPTQTSTTPAPPAPAATTPAASPEAGAGPTVVVQRSQQPTPGRRRGANSTGSGEGARGGGRSEGGERAAEKAAGGSGAAAAGGANGVAPAPQAAGEEASALATLLAGSSVSAQALDFYRIPLFLLPVYQAASFQYGVPWQILAAINEIETDYGTDQSVSTAGALGWMQFMPGTWLQYGVDATGAGYADPYNPVDAIFASARYLHAAGAGRHLRAAIFAYNHSQEYVESVLLRARLIASYPRAVIATLTALVDGRAPTANAHLAPGAIAALAAQAAAAQAGGGAAGEAAPAGGGASSATAGAVALAPAPASAAAQALPAGDGAAGAAAGTAKAPAKPATPGSTAAPSPRVAAARARAAANAAAKPSQLVELLGARGAPVVAVEDGRVEHLGRSRSLGRYLVLRDVYGDVFTYAGLGSIAPRYRPSVPREHPSPTRGGEPAQDPAPVLPASAGHQRPLTLKVKARARQALPAAGAALESEGENVPAGMGRVRLFAHPGNPIAHASMKRAARAGGSGGWRTLRAGSVVSKGTVLGHLDTPTGASAGQLRFAVRPAGDGATIDPEPLLANWRQLGVALHPKGSRATDALLGATAADALAMSKGELERAALADTGIQLDACARRDVAAGAVDRRVLAVLVFLSRSGLQPTVAAVRCPRGGVSPSGLSVAAAGENASAALLPAARRGAGRRGGDAVDVTAINGIPLAGHQGSGTIADAAIRTLLTLHGRFAPHAIESLMRYPGAPTTRALPAAWNHIRIVFAPLRRGAEAHVATAGPTAASPLALTGDLSEAQWSRLIGRIAALAKPAVEAAPSSAAIRDPQAAPTNRGLGARGLGGG